MLDGHGMVCILDARNRDLSVSMRRKTHVQILGVDCRLFILQQVTVFFRVGKAASDGYGLASDVYVYKSIGVSKS